jgi:exonuclease VII small subunit
LQKRRTTDPFRQLIVRAALGVCLSISGLLINTAAAKPAQADQKEDRDPARRCEKFLEAAEAAFDTARSAYTKDDVHKGDAELDEMVTALNSCVSTLDTAHKSRLYKRAEMRVSTLQRRMQSLLDEISVTQRGWAEQIVRKLEEIHDKLLEGAMKK